MQEKSYRQCLLDNISKILNSRNSNQELSLAESRIQDGFCPICCYALTNQGGCYNCDVESYFPRYNNHPKNINL
jgi:hypothetical protein